MTTSQDVAVTYTGTDDPFKDRIYRSGLTFAPGQTRLVPFTLAQRFLRHADVFKLGKTAEQLAAEAALAEVAAAQAAADLARQQQEAKTEADRIAAEQAEAEAKQKADEATAAAEAARQAAEAAAKEKPEGATETKDDTAAVLAQQQKEMDEARQREDARYALIDSIESMDRAAVISWADLNYKQKIPGNVSVAKARDIAKGFIDQYGMPA